MFNAAGGAYDIALSSTDDLDLGDNVSVSDWAFGGTGKFQNFDANAQVSMPNDNVTKIDGDAQTQPAVGTSTNGFASVSLSIDIPAGTQVDLTSVTFDFRKATGSGNIRCAGNQYRDNGSVATDRTTSFQP